MKKFLLIHITLFVFSGFIYSQVQEGTGKPIMEIITDFHLDLNDTAKTTGFGISRAYFGYNYLPGKNFSCKIILNIGTPEDLPKPAAPRRYAFFREASVTYAKDKIKLSFGIVTTNHFDLPSAVLGKKIHCN